MRSCTLSLIFIMNLSVHCTSSVQYNPDIGLSTKMRPQRRLYRIHTVCFLIFTIPWKCKHVSFYAKPLNKSLKEFNQSSFFVIFMSSLQSHHLRVTLQLHLIANICITQSQVPISSCIKSYVPCTIHNCKE